MTLGDLLSQMGIGTKHLTERYSHAEYASAPMHDSHMIYQYEPAPAHHVASSKHHHGGGGHKSNAAMSALTLLAFLFFLHILQQCLKDHMMAMSTPPVVVMTAGREGEQSLPTSNGKLDKTGPTTAEAKNNNPEVDLKTKINNENNAKHSSFDDAADKGLLMKINTEEYRPKTDAPKYKHVFKNYGNKSMPYPGYVYAMDED